MNERERLEAHEAHYLASERRMRVLLVSGFASTVVIEELAEVLRLLVEVREELRAWKQEVSARDVTEPRELPS